MDLLSDKITLLLDFKLHSKLEEIDKTLISEKNYKLLTELEGRLNIFIDGNRFFSEDGILLLELGIDLYKWVAKISTGSYSNFIYETMSYSEEPIIEFLKEDGELWLMRSIWQNFECRKKISESKLLESINSFLNDLRESLIKKYNVDIDWFI